MKKATPKSVKIGDPIDAIVNVAGTDGERLLKVVVRLEFPGGKRGIREGMKKILAAGQKPADRPGVRNVFGGTQRTGGKRQNPQQFMRKINNTMPKVEWPTFCWTSSLSSKAPPSLIRAAGKEQREA